MTSCTRLARDSFHDNPLIFDRTILLRLLLLSANPYILLLLPVLDKLPINHWSSNPFTAFITSFTMSLPSSTSTGATHVPRKYPLKLSDEHQKALDDVWDKLRDLPVDNCLELKKACKTAWDITCNEYRRIYENVGTANDDELRVMGIMQDVMDELGFVLMEYRTSIAREGEEGRVERMREAGQKAKRNIERMLGIGEPGLDEPEKASTGADTGTDRRFQHTDKSDNTAPDSQVTNESGGTNK